ncbi:MAG: hypothetical protein EBZ05_06725, partial [Verrucomicrobia bacterium]|nr:hypothetical protein [Verrucomicrobiota bacterium]
MIFHISELGRMGSLSSAVRFFAWGWIVGGAQMVAHGHMIGDAIHDSVGVATASTMQPASVTLPAGNGSLLSSSFMPFEPKVRISWDTNYFYVESDGFPDRVIMP